MSCGRRFSRRRSGAVRMVRPTRMTASEKASPFRKRPLDGRHVPGRGRGLLPGDTRPGRILRVLVQAQGNMQSRNKCRELTAVLWCGCGWPSVRRKQFWFGWARASAYEFVRACEWPAAARYPAWFCRNEIEGFPPCVGRSNSSKREDEWEHATPAGMEHGAKYACRSAAGRVLRRSPEGSQVEDACDAGVAIVGCGRGRDGIGGILSWCCAVVAVSLILP